ncbi:hypothetical protein EDM57_03550 [Brevibacillus gelatini]|uniref:Uncharacterized protein n=1 Tax=Brevibacillus gelatini TaxID=1655277 RepID=A0A3M8B8N8_9BACL|nr:hypothetical protein [Brevibacillus gelatini]RNB59730.1 hypothetical protein EDM57_03550 [Brevibacillus gelatini]
MLGTIWINAGMGLVAFVITFCTALLSNVWLVSLERAAIALVVFFLAAFPIRFVLALVTQTPVPSVTAEGAEEASVPLDEAGTEAKSTDQTVETVADEAFSPLSFTKLETVPPIENPATVAEVVRRLTDE